MHSHMFSIVPTFTYPEYWFTPLVVSQMPEFLTNSILAPLAAWWKMFHTAPSRSSTAW